MSEPTIFCPKCKEEIKLTESLAAPLIESTRLAYEKRLTQKDEENSDKLKQERAKIAAEENKKAKLAVATDLDEKNNKLAELEEILLQRNAKLAEAQKSQAEFLKKERALADKEREVDLTVEKKIQEGIGAAREQAKNEASEELKLKFAEKDKTITDLQVKLQDALRQAEQGSQQLQGEVQELELESLLRAKFPFDTIQPVPKGEYGGDVLHRVVNSFGQPCGTILWESKRTKNWSDGWLVKLREDQRTAKAEVAIIITQALPKGIEAFDWVESVCVAHPRVALPVVTLLRQGLIEAASARQASEGQQTKTELVYQYLTGPRFRQRLQAIVEAFSSMQEELFSEKKVITKQWAKREEQIERVMQSTVGMYGDLQGIAGKSLQEIEGLEMKVLGIADNGRLNNRETEG